MCWAYRFADGGIAAANEAIAAPHAGRITRAGQETPMLVRRAGLPTWELSRYGMSFPKSGGGRQLIWNARDDKMDKVESWARLMRQRFAVPVDAYVENAPGETWYIGPVSWMVGVFDTSRDGGAVVITKQGQGDDRMPILLDRQDALAWLAADHWDALPGLLKAPSRTFAEADLFEGKSLATDARTTVPLRRAA
jgi:putative SOS response-associated peptidase YedK